MRVRVGNVEVDNGWDENFGGGGGGNNRIGREEKGVVIFGIWGFAKSLLRV